MDPKFLPGTSSSTGHDQQAVHRKALPLPTRGRASPAVPLPRDPDGQDPLDWEWQDGDVFARRSAGAQPSEGAFLDDDDVEDDDEVSRQGDNDNIAAPRSETTPCDTRS